MITEKKNALRPILESFEGIHLTAYLINNGQLIELKSQLKKTIEEAHQWLYGILTHEQRNKFLEPLESLLNDTRILKGIKGNIGIFRNESSFQIINIPIDIEPSFQVAASFHVKPILRWLQGDQEFLLLGLERGSAHLYLGSQHTFKLIDSILFPEFLKSKEYGEGYESLQKLRALRQKEAETYSWLNDWIAELTKTSRPRLFLAGEPAILKVLEKNLEYKNSVKTPIATFFNTHSSIDICYEIRKLLKNENKKNISKTLMEFRFAEEENRAWKNIFQISKAVVEGKVRKLIVTDEINIFGKIDPKSGGLSIHPTDLDHEDDCILDDLAQMVLSQGGEVIVAKRSEIPQGRPIIAILDEEESFAKSQLIPAQTYQGRSI